MFEDYFTELQSDMVAICLEYVENYADMIYIYGSCEPNVLTADVFFKINGAFDAEYKYEPVYSNDYEKTSSDIVDEWFAEENK